MTIAKVLVQNEYDVVLQSVYLTVVCIEDSSGPKQPCRLCGLNVNGHRELLSHLTAVHFGAALSKLVESGALDFTGL